MSVLSYIITGLASYFALTVSLFGLSLKIPSAGFFARCLASYACLIACASYGVIISIVLRLVGHGNIIQWATARAFRWTMRLTTGSRFQIIDGQENLLTRPAVFITNHQTELDVLLLGEVFPKYCSQTAKKSLRNVPILGWFMAASGSVFIDRSNRQTSFQAFDKAANQMREQKQSVIIFPEGTRSYASEPGLLPFKKGAFHLAVQAQVDIVPIVAENYAHRMSVKNLRFEPGPIRVKVLPPISTKGLTPADVDKLTQDTREAMLQAVKDMWKTRDEFLASRQATPVVTQTRGRTTAMEI